MTTLRVLAERLQIQHHAVVQLVDRLADGGWWSGDPDAIVGVVAETLVRQSTTGRVGVPKRDGRGHTMRTSGVLSTMAVALVLLSGCAKSPATAVTAAPPPVGAATTSAGSAPTRDASTSAVEAAPPTSSAPAGSSAAPPTGRSATATSRPAPDEFVPARELQDVYFDFDRYAIRPEGAPILDGHARWLRTNGDTLLLIEGHCDERGTSDYNLALGERRATATMQYLVAQGISPRRITIISYGKERPQCPDHHEACWAKNRRVHFLVKRG